MNELFQKLLYHFNVEPNRRGWCDVDCPFCGNKHRLRDKPNFSFSQHGFKCYSCGAAGGLKYLVQHVGLWEKGDWTGKSINTSTFQSHHQRVEEPIPWADNATSLQKSYVSHPQKVERWQEYKPLKEKTIKQHGFGVGKLPGNFDDRLIVPVYDQQRQIIAFHGRSLTNKLKWKSAVGSKKRIPWGWYGIRPGQKLWVLENYADAALLMQYYPEETAIALGMVRTFRDEEIKFLSQRRPDSVMVAFDNDMIGQASDELYQEMYDEWKRTHTPHVKPPVRHGPLVVTQIQALGIPAACFQWRPEDPPKMDMGDLLKAAWRSDWDTSYQKEEQN